MSLISIVSVLLLVAMASADQPRKYDLENAPALFEEFIQTHDRKYADDADREAHYRAFIASLHKINELNEKNPSATYGINKFADYTEDEKKSMFGVRGTK